MLQYLLTCLAGIALGVVGMRVWQSSRAAPAEQYTGNSPAEPAVSASETQPAAPAPTRKLLIGAGALLALAIAVFALRSGDNTESTPAGPMAASGGTDATGKAVGDVDSMITRLADRLAKEPNDGEGFRMLGWSYVMTGHPDKAIEPYKRALVLLPGKAIVHAGYGEAMVGAAGGTVSAEAKATFDKAVALDPAEPRARYFLALWQAQHGQEKEALDKWIAIANQGPADASWQGDVRRKISETAAKLGVDVSARLKVAAQVGAIAAAPAVDPGAMQAASALPPADRQAMIDGMVEGLAAKLKTNPKDADGWVRLLRSRMVLKQDEQAAKDLASARAALTGNAAALAMVNAAAAEFGVPGSQ